MADILSFKKRLQIVGAFVMWIILGVRILVLSAGSLRLAGAVALGLVAAVGEENWGADERKLFADFAFEETFIRPME